MAMHKLTILTLSLFALCVSCKTHPGTDPGLSILHNHLGYYPDGHKKAIVQGTEFHDLNTFELRDAKTHEVVFSGQVEKSGTVDHWKNWIFWTLEFSAFDREGKYFIDCRGNNTRVVSQPFIIQHDLLERNTLSDIIYYFKCKRAVGAFEKADKNIPFKDWPEKRVDAHGGWMDATGDYSKALSHLSSSTYFNPQQLPLVAYNLFNVYRELENKQSTFYTQYKERILDEAFYGADYLVRIHPVGSSFYQNINAPGKEKAPEDRYISKTNNTLEDCPDPLPVEAWYCASYRSGAGLSIAALAQAGGMSYHGDFDNSTYLKVAKEAFDHLNRFNRYYTNNGQENIVDDYCALIAATELFRTTGENAYLKVANVRAESLIGRLGSDERYQNYWVADDTDRPFFHAADAGLVAVSLLHFAELAGPDMASKIFETVKKSLEFELAITNEVNNPFGYARQYVQDIDSKRYSSFFFPHRTETRWWWQGEDARLGSLVTAAKLTARAFAENQAFSDQLDRYASDQINWILGLNPFDVCMLTGTGRNNPEYMYLGSWEYTATPGGICNGITAGLSDSTDIDFQVPYEETGTDHDWRWGEQWIPHTAWYIYAISLFQN